MDIEDLEDREPHVVCNVSTWPELKIERAVQIAKEMGYFCELCSPDRTKEYPRLIISYPDGKDLGEYWKRLETEPEHH